jgi:GntP family gluconate:H+ symporter
MTAGIFQIGIALIISITAIILLTRFLSLHAFFSLIIASFLFGLLAGKPFIDILGTMQSGFGSLLQQIGLLVAIGSCLGILLEKTGAMEVISHRIVQVFGKKNSILAMTFIGVIVGIPVFCDSGFIILSRLIPSIASRTVANPAQLSLALSSGLYTTHTLVPPTPGPLAAAANLNIAEHISSVIIAGVITSIPVALVSFFFAKQIGKKITIANNHPIEIKSETNLSAWKAFLPLTVPIVLIASSSLPKMMEKSNGITSLLQIIGQPIAALLIGLLLAIPLIPKKQISQSTAWIAEALKDAGVILLITGAGGAFGAVIKTSGIDVILKESISQSQMQGVVFLIIGYAIAAILKTAQGSTTSSMIITSSLLAPLAISAGFIAPSHLSLLVVAIGGGAMTVSHANDSYFWVVSQFSGIAPRDAFRSFTLLTFLQGFTALVTSIVLFLIL